MIEFLTQPISLNMPQMILWLVGTVFIGIGIGFVASRSKE